MVTHIPQFSFAYNNKPFFLPPILSFIVPLLLGPVIRFWEISVHLGMEERMEELEANKDT